MNTGLDEALRTYLHRNWYTYTPGVLSKLSGVPKMTIVNWLSGRVARPRHWQDLVRVAYALRLDEAETTTLLAAAGQPSLAELFARTDLADDALLSYWRTPNAPASPVPATSPPAHLPTFPTSLVGRTHERALAGQLLHRAHVRLLTLTGIGGTGKTRLALQIANDLRHAFTDGVFWVALASIADPQLVPGAIAQALGIAEPADQQASALLKAAVRDKTMLLVLDTVEHVLPAAPLVADLVAAAPNLTVLATSRSVLHLYGEYVFEVPPLPLPTLAPLASIDALQSNEAVALFVQRARMVNPAFTLDHTNAYALAELCVRLDGIPLAIELAAARMQLLSLPGLLQRLSDKFGILTGGSRNLPARHQTLRATLDRSYDLLHADTQRVFAQMSVFRGGASLSAVAHVIGGDVADDPRRSGADLELGALNRLQALRDSSLVQQTTDTDGEHRFVMLETIREYAQERLRADVAAAAHERHATYFAALAEQAAAVLGGAEQASWLARLDAEQGNVRAAFAWLLKQGAAERVLQVVSVLRRYWFVRGEQTEARRWLAQALGSDTRISGAVRAAALSTAGVLAYTQGDYPAATEALEEAHVWHQQNGDPLGMADVARSAGTVALLQARYDRAVPLLERSAALYRALGDDAGIARAVTSLAVVYERQGRYDEAVPLYEETLGLYRALGDTSGVGLVLGNLGTTALRRGAYDEGEALLAEALRLAAAVGDRGNMAWLLGSRGRAALFQERHDQAWVDFTQGLRIGREVNEKADMIECLEGLAIVAGLQRAFARAARLVGAAEAARNAVGAPMPPADRTRYNQYLAQFCAAADPALWTMAAAAGGVMTLEQAIDLALDAP